MNRLSGFPLGAGLALVVSLVLAVGGCATEGSTTDSQAGGSAGGSADTAGSDGDQLHPEVLDAVFEQGDDGSWTIAVTLSSPYDTPERYADAWRVTSIGGTSIFGVRELTHDHANEQPFTRSQSGIVIPAVEETVLVQGRDLENGWGDPKEFTLP